MKQHTMKWHLSSEENIGKDIIYPNKTKWERNPSPIKKLQILNSWNSASYEIRVNRASHVSHANHVNRVNHAM